MTDPIIEEIKERIDIVDLIGNYITLKQAGANFKGLCPFHGEKTPSFMVNRQRQIFRCFGCGEAGDIFTFIQKQENIDFPNALRLLADKAGVKLPEKSFSRKDSKTADEKQTLYQVNVTAAKFFHQVLVSHPSGKNALTYLHNRGVTDASIKTFQIGYAPSSNTPIQSVLKKYDFLPKLIVSAGSPDRFRDRVMFPFRDVIGQTVGFSGRSLHDQTPKYLNTSETGLFRKNRFLYGLYEGKKAIGQMKKIVLVEGQIDLVLAHQSGINCTVATSGTALTDDHLRVLRRYSDILHLALDGDVAGRKATERAIGMSLSHAFDVSVIVMPEGLDPGEMIAHQSEAWHKAVEKPMPAIDWLFLYYFPEMHKPSATEVTQIFSTLFPYIAKQKDNMISQTYNLQRLGIRLGIKDERVILKAYESWREKHGKKPDNVADKSKDRDEQEQNAWMEARPNDNNEEAKREKSLIGLIIVRPNLLEYQAHHLTEKDFTLPMLSRLYTRILSWYNNTTNRTSEDLIRHIEAFVPKSAHQTFQKFLFDAQTNIADLGEDQMLQEYSFLVQIIRQKQRDERIQNYADLIARAEADGDRSRVLKLMHDMQLALKQKELHAKEDS